MRNELTTAIIEDLGGRKDVLDGIDEDILEEIESAIDDLIRVRLIPAYKVARHASNLMKFAGKHEDHWTSSEYATHEDLRDALEVWRATNEKEPER